MCESKKGILMADSKKVIKLIHRKKIEPLVEPPEKPAGDTMAREIKEKIKSSRTLKLVVPKKKDGR